MRGIICIILLFPHIWMNADSSGPQESKNQTTFIPTTQWQVVKNGTPIPRGLHVRHNFQTGITEAKLMNPEDETSETNNAMKSNDDGSPKSVALLPETMGEITEKKKVDSQSSNTIPMTAKELSIRLKELKKSKLSTAEINKKKKRRMEDSLSRGVYENINLDGVTDAEVLAVFIEEFNEYKNAIASGSLNNEEVKTITDILSQLEYLVHDIDNGLEFTRVGGLAKVISPCMNGTNEEIKYEALRVFGAAVQSNPHVKEVALSLEFVPSILRTMVKCTDSKLRDRCIYALGSLVRHYPAAQKVFLDHGGMEIFVTILAEGEAASQKRTMNLINDLILERRDLDDAGDFNEFKNNEYADVSLEEKMVLHKFCKQLGDLLVKTVNYESKTEFDMENHDLLEAIYECILTASDICKDDFQRNESQILPALNVMDALYRRSEKTIDPDDDDDELFRYLSKLTQEVKRTMFAKSKDEL